MNIRHPLAYKADRSRLHWHPAPFVFALHDEDTPRPVLDCLWRAYPNSLRGASCAVWRIGTRHFYATMISNLPGVMVRVQLQEIREAQA